MLKHLYKTFLISIMCGSLLSFQTTALAAGTNTTDSSGVITNTQSHSFDKIKDEDMLASLGMLAGGFITGRMMSVYTPMTNDVMVAGAAGVAFVAGEILSNMKFKGTIDEMTVEVQKKSDGTVNEEQIQRLQDLKKSYEEAKKTTKTKKTLQLASAVGFGAAAAMAGYMAYTEYSSMQACNAAIAAANTAATTCPDAVTAAAATPVSATLVAEMKASCGVCAGHIKSYAANMKLIDTARISPGPTMQEKSKIIPLQSKAKAEVPLMCSVLAVIPETSKAAAAALKPCLATLELQSINQIFGYAAKLTASTMSSKPYKKVFFPNVDPYYQQMQSINYADAGIMKKLIDMIVPSAEASWLPLLGLGGGIAAAFALATTTAAQTLDFMMFVPFNRSVAFGALAGVALLASKSSDNVISKLDENIKKIDAILADLDKNAKGIKAQNVSQQQIAIKTISSESQAVIPFNANSSTKTECMQSNSSENCKSVTDQLKSMPGFANLPDSFKDIASQTTSLGDSLSGSSGISGSTLASADSLGSKQNALSKLVKNRQAAYEKLTGGKANYAKEQEKFLKGLNGAVKKALQQKGMTASAMMASIGSSPISGAANAIPKEDELKKTPAAAGAVDIAAHGGGEEKDKSLDLNFKDTTAEAPAVDMSGGTVSKAPEYQIDSNEINGQNGPSLFEVISSRYLKSGYPKLLEEETAAKKE